MRPLEGIRVIDFTHALAGPICTFQLHLLGADVIKVERPRLGDDMRHYTEHAGLPGMAAPFVAFNAGKRSIALDLKSADGQETARRLTARADVVVENFRPGVTATMGLDAATVRACSPRLIYASLTGFGQTGPLRAWAAYDHIIQAMSGAMSINGEPGQDPLKLGVPVADAFTGYYSAFAILGALLARERGGGGQTLDISMLDSTLVLMAPVIAGTLLSGQAPIRTGNRGFRLIATSDTYRTADGYIAIGANQQAQFERMCEVLEVPALASDPRFADHRSRMAHGSELREAFEEVFARLRADDVESKLAAARVPVSKVRDVNETLSHPQVTHRGVLLEAEVPGLGHPARVVGSGYRTDDRHPQLAGEVPAVGQHTAEILAELGYTESDIRRLTPSP